MADTLSLQDGIDNGLHGHSLDEEKQEQPANDNDAAQNIQKTTTAQDWTGPNDLGNPYNWPFWKKIYNTMAPGFFSFTVSFASSAITPANPDIIKQFHVSSTVAVLPLSLYVLGLAFGPMIASPLSETSGRKPIYFLSSLIFGLFTVGAGVAQNMATLCICRFFAGAFGGSPLAVGGGSVADIWSVETRALPSGVFILMPFLGPAMGPIIGGFVSERKGWRWTQWIIEFAIAGSLLFGAFISETHKRTILVKRAKNHGLLPPDPPAKGLAALKTSLQVTLLRPTDMLFTEPIVTFFSLYVAFNFAVLYGFFEAFPYTFTTVYDFNRGEVGLTFLAIGLGCILSLVTVGLIEKLKYQPLLAQAKQNGNSGLAPEHRLYPAMLGCFGLPISLFWLGWTARRSIHWISPVLAAVPFAWGNLNVFMGSATYLIDTYHARNGASALAANGLLRYLLGAVFPLFTTQMYKNLGIDWATSLFGFISIALIPIPLVLYRWGPEIRAKSKYNTS